MRETAEHERSALAGTNLAEAMDRLPWFCPSVAALTALGRSPSAETWSVLRHDPSAVLLLLRQPGSTCTDRLDSPALLDEVLHHLEAATPAIVDWNAPSIRAILQTGHVVASIAELLARKLGRGDVESAWTAGLLVPLGWYAACAIDVNKTAACLADPALTTDPVETQRRHWGIDAVTLARRVARRLNLPKWLTAVVGNLALAPRTATELGADVVLFRITRLAVGLARERGFDLGGPTGDRTADTAALGLLPEDVNRLEVPTTQPDCVWQDPRQVPLLLDLLKLAAENRRIREGTLRRQIEAEADRLHDALEEQVRCEAERLQASKLAALAEFAAGAGHEINNPLAVISGQAQYILGHAEEWLTPSGDEGGRKALQTIIAQTKRIHGLLRDLMQFARPTPARPIWFDLAELLTESAATLHELAEQRHVRLEVDPGPGTVRIQADREQVKTALTNLLRNSVEAAPAEGWARIVLNPPAESCVAVAVEDNGAGPDRTQCEHLFDPFYSGRSAGRGRGLGLPIAWRLAQLQSGDVYFDEPQSGAPTRFVLQLPWSPAPEPPPPVPVVSTPVFAPTIKLNGVALNGTHHD